MKNNLTDNSMKTKQMQVAKNLTVNITADQQHEFLMTSKDVAYGYGVNIATLRSHKREHRDELVEGKHFIKGVGKTNTLSNAQPHQIFWTKRGIVRLGFFIKSERAKMFRDWAEDLVITISEQAALSGLQLLPDSPKRRHNRLTPERMIDILADIAKIDNAELRLSLVNKLTNGN